MSQCDALSRCPECKALVADLNEKRQALKEAGEAIDALRAENVALRKHLLEMIEKDSQVRVGNNERV